MKIEIINQEILEQIQLSNESDNYIIIYNQKTYKVGKILYSFIENLKDYDLAIAINLVQEKFDVVENDINTIINRVNTLLESLTIESTEKKYIFFSKILINREKTNYISDQLKIFFSKKIFLSVFPLLIIVNALFFINNAKLIYGTTDLKIYEILIFYISLLIILIAHELGHASACKFYGIKPNEIGFGIYLLFPVLYSNVSGIWRLSKMKRIIVNLGGIYFQLIFSAVLFLLYYCLKNYDLQNVLLILIRVNAFIFLYSLMPFIRNDGYWIYSDYFDLPNLNKESNKWLIETFKSFRSKRKKSLKGHNFWLALYSMGNHIFIVYISISMFLFIKKFIENISEIDFSNNFTTFLSEIKPFIFSLIISVLILYLFAKSFISWIKTNLLYIKNHN